MGRARRFVSNCFRKYSSSTPSPDNNTSHDEKVIASIAAEEERKGGAVLVELFSSQGCATSPQAELLFSRLGRGDFNLERPVILLAYHVDYWDYTGWKDPYSSSLWTVRQKAYVESLNLDTMFTPQIVVQGKAQCLGDDEDAILSCIASANRDPALAFQVCRSIILLFILKKSIISDLGTEDIFEKKPCSIYIYNLLKSTCSIYVSGYTLLEDRRLI